MVCNFYKEKELKSNCVIFWAFFVTEDKRIFYYVLRRKKDAENKVDRSACSFIDYL